MITINRGLPLLEQNRARDNVILLDDLEFVMPKEQLQQITDLHNEGMHYLDIAEEVGRDKFEVIIALLHQVKARKPMLPFACTGRRRMK